MPERSGWRVEPAAPVLALMPQGAVHPAVRSDGEQVDVMAVARNRRHRHGWRRCDRGALSHCR